MTKKDPHTSFSVSALVDMVLSQRVLSRRVLANLSDDDRATLQKDLRLVRRLIGEQRTPKIAVVGPADQSLPAVVKSILGESIEGDPTQVDRLEAIIAKAQAIWGETPATVAAMVEPGVESAGIAESTATAFDGGALEFGAAMGTSVGVGFALRGVARTAVRFVPVAGSVVAAGIASTATYTMGQGAIAYFIGERR